ncbi:MAG: thioredoxin domain-containing protein [Actinomycetota bacterium]|nr:thioredoxin domain-containing protein [Actinomycetota bacterium]
MANRLAGETSPYLLQHKDNPVDWLPWGDEALERARREDKPILLSIGYAACHWCHVMEHESFEDPDTARLMNEHFVPVKVDREERPDLDAVYMEAVQAMTGQGGWPMTVWLTPDEKPFYGGTYFPPQERGGLPSFKRLLVGVADAWANRRAEIEEQGTRLMGAMSSLLRLEPSTEVVSEGILDDAFDGLKGAFDPQFGGFGGAPKFPQPMTVDLLMRLGYRGRSEATDMANLTLDAMAAGGMFDQLGGGFSRYSVDRAWIVPHFEKMLYDNAQLLRTYARAWQAGRRDRHRTVAEATASWMLGEMRDEAGGFWSSLDADSEGVEGKFYVWSLDEVKEVTGPDADAAIDRWGFTEAGNFEGLNIPIDRRGPQSGSSTGPTSSGTPSSGSGETAVITRAREALLARRAERVRPGTDTKVLSAWNALAASALAESGVILQHPEWVDAAGETMRFVLDTLRVEGRLMRSYRQVNGTGVVKHLGYCEDYAFALEACLALYEATFDPGWLAEARWAADEAIRLFLDHESGGFFTTGTDAPALVTRSKDFVDNAIPSANSVLALELQRLSIITGDSSYEGHGLAIIRLMRDAAARSPLGFGHLLGAVDFYTAMPAEIVIVGDAAGEDAAQLLAIVRGRFIPNKVVIVGDESIGGATSQIPLLRGRSKRNGRATAYVCRRGTCKYPVDTSEELVAQLATR